MYIYRATWTIWQRFIYYRWFAYCLFNTDILHSLYRRVYIRIYGKIWMTHTADIYCIIYTYILGKGNILYFFNDVPAKGTWEVHHLSTDLNVGSALTWRRHFKVFPKRICIEWRFASLLLATLQACLVPTKSDIVHLVVRYLDSGGRGAYSAFKALTGKALYNPLTSVHGKDMCVLHAVYGTYSSLLRTAARGILPSKRLEWSSQVVALPKKPAKFQAMAPTWPPWLIKLFDNECLIHLSN